AYERDACTGSINGGRTGADVTPSLPLGRRRSQQQLFGGDATHQPFVPKAANAMTHKARDLRLVHRKDQPCRRAGTTKRIAYLGDVRNRCSITAELARNLNTKELLLSGCVYRCFWKAARTINVIGVAFGNSCRFGRPLRERQPSLLKKISAC